MQRGRREEPPGRDGLTQRPRPCPRPLDPPEEPHTQRPERRHGKGDGKPYPGARFTGLLRATAPTGHE